MRRVTTRTEGFTLIELLVVIAIIGILAAMLHGLHSITLHFHTLLCSFQYDEAWALA